jgi:hypothetical protein
MAGRVGGREWERGREHRSAVEASWLGAAWRTRALVGGGWRRRAGSDLRSCRLDIDLLGTLRYLGWATFSISVGYAEI